MLLMLMKLHSFMVKHHAYEQIRLSVCLMITVFSFGVTISDQKIHSISIWQNILRQLSKMKLKIVLSESGYNRYLENILKLHISDVLTNMETDTELFENLLCSYPFRVRAVKKC